MRTKKKKTLKAAYFVGASDGFQRWLMAGQPSAKDDPDGVWEAFLAMWDRIGLRYATGYLWFSATGESLDHQDYGEEPDAAQRQEALDEFCWRTGTHAGNDLRCMWCAAMPLRRRGETGRTCAT